jgi:transketolase
MIDRKKIYRRILDLAITTGHAHLPSAFSVVEVLCQIYENKTDEDVVILSKGHGCYAQYAILQEIGVMSEDYPIKGHPDKGMPGIACSTGSLGHGLPIAVGMALAKQIRHCPGVVYVVCGDGESEEGSFYEAWCIAYKLGLKNLSVTVDNNERRFEQIGIWGLPHLMFNPKGWPSKLLMSDPKAWHHRVPTKDELEVLLEEIDALPTR